MLSSASVQWPQLALIKSCPSSESGFSMTVAHETTIKDGNKGVFGFEYGPYKVSGRVDDQNWHVWRTM